MSPPLSPIQLVIGEPLPLMPLMTGLTAYPPIRVSEASPVCLVSVTTKISFKSVKGYEAALDRHVFVGFDNTGTVRDTIYGPGSLVVTP
jgi:hypothetical protein